MLQTSNRPTPIGDKSCLARALTSHDGMVLISPSLYAEINTASCQLEPYDRAAQRYPQDPQP